MLIKEHKIQGCEFLASPHFNERPNEKIISLLVIHNISLPAGNFTGTYISDLFLGRLDSTIHPSFADLKGVKVSAHCLIRRDGQLIQYVPFDKRAWHAGVSNYKGTDNCNDFSIGIELEGTDYLDYTPIQYQVLSVLAKSLIKHYPSMSIQDVVGHQDIAPDRKTDPGESFDWSYFRELLQEQSDKI